jgi:hypothetical protein
LPFFLWPDNFSGWLTMFKPAFAVALAQKSRNNQPVVITFLPEVLLKFLKNLNLNSKPDKKIKNKIYFDLLKHLSSLKF